MPSWQHSSTTNIFNKILPKSYSTEPLLLRGANNESYLFMLEVSVIVEPRVSGLSRRVASLRNLVLTRRYELSITIYLALTKRYYSATGTVDISSTLTTSPFSFSWSKPFCHRNHNVMSRV